jgi:nicotinate-nucleotide adenylyltransferase
LEFPVCPGKGLFVRLGLFGGTFNPIHFGHLRAAIEVREAFNLDKLLLIPSANPPHKIAGQVADAEDRLEMVRLAVEGEPFLEASEIELARPGPSYTIQTLRHFHERFGPESSIHFIVGQDAFSEITTWKSYKELFGTAHFIVMTRPGSKLGSIEDFIHTNISEAYQYDLTSNGYGHPEWCKIFCLDITHLDISASEIRERIRQGRSIRFLIPHAVEDFVVKKELYR